MMTQVLAIGHTGVIVNMFVSVSTPYAMQLRKIGHSLPSAVEVPALLDTGADCTLLDESIAIQNLRLRPTNRVQVNCLDTQKGAEWRNAYDVDIIFASDQAESSKFTIPVASHSFPPTLPYKAVVGRDLLRHSSFRYDGPNHEVTFSASNKMLPLPLRERVGVRGSVHSVRRS